MEFNRSPALPGAWTRPCTSVSRCYGLYLSSVIHQQNWSRWPSDHPHGVLLPYGASAAVSYDRVDALMPTTRALETTAYPEMTEQMLRQLQETSYRHVDIALVTETALFARQLGVHVWAAIYATDTKPFDFALVRPGPAFGGHFLPIDRSTVRCADRHRSPRSRECRRS